MSGERLREASIAGDVDGLRKYIGYSCNVCSADEYGLTCLHYSVWNGHLECVKFIASNPWGVDSQGVRGSVMDMVSCKGLTALHLACTDCPSDVEAIIHVLLVSGADTDIKDKLGKSAYEYACSNIDPEAKEAFYNLDSTGIQDLMKHLHDKYTYATNKRWNVTQEDMKDATFEAPLFLYEEHHRKPYIPKGLTIHEHQILPLINEGAARRGIDSLHCLDFVKDQADKYEDRRGCLVKAGDASWDRYIRPRKVGKR